MLKWFGYVKVNSERIEDKETEYFTDDEDVEISQSKEITKIRRGGLLTLVEGDRLTMWEINWWAMKYVTQDKYKLLPVKPNMIINRLEDLLRAKTEKDSAGWGSRAFKEQIRGKVTIMSPDGKIVALPTIN